MNGNRIGYGKGFYDKFLIGFKKFKIGICYDFQLVKSFSKSNQDIPIDAIITEKNVYEIRR